MAGFEMALITNVQKHPCLWDYNIIAYRNKHEIANAWQAISKILNVPEKAIRLRWRSLRDRFTVEMRKIKSSKTYKRSHWVYFKPLTFLSDFVKTRAEQAVEMRKNLEKFGGKILDEEATMDTDDKTTENISDYREIHDGDDVQHDLKEDGIIENGDDSLTNNENQKNMIFLIETVEEAHANTATTMDKLNFENVILEEEVVETTQQTIQLQVPKREKCSEYYKAYAPQKDSFAHINDNNNSNNNNNNNNKNNISNRPSTSSRPRSTIVIQKDDAFVTFINDIFSKVPDHHKLDFKMDVLNYVYERYKNLSNLE